MLSEHISYCDMTILRAPTGSKTARDEEFNFVDLAHMMNVEAYPYGDRSVHLTAKNIEIALSDLTGTNGAVWVRIVGPVKAEILIELLYWINSIPIYRCFKHESGLYNKLLKRGWNTHKQNIHCLYKNGTYARFVYNYVVFGAFLKADEVYEQQDCDSVQLLFKTKLNRIKQLEKRYDKNK
jgi:hypothetical protein